MVENTEKTLDDKVACTFGKKTTDGLLSVGVGFALGVATRLNLGENSYAWLGGATAAGVAFSFSQKSKPLGTFINIVSCQAGYYAGVYATEYTLNLMK